MALPLEQLKILDLTRLLPGPYCTMLLADMGADVVKVEDPESGDILRYDGPPTSSGMGIHFHVLNRNKRSVALGLKSEEGREVLMRLARWADVLVEQFRPGVMERLGISYEEVAKENPSIIYCSITGYGDSGPYSQLPGHDVNYISYAGVLGLTGRSDGPPVIPAVQVADIGGGMLAAFSILAAYIYRGESDKGQKIDVSMTDAAISMLSMNTGEYLVTGKPPVRQEQKLHGALPCYDVYEAADGFLAVGALEPKFWMRLCEVLGKPEFVSLQYEEKSFPEIHQWLSQTFKAKTRSEWMEIFGDEEVCVSPVLSLKETDENPHVRHRNMMPEVSDEKLGRMKTLGIPAKFSLTPGEIRHSAPQLGENTDEILLMLGYSSDEIDELERDGVVRKFRGKR
ncbi:MAG: CoA transferase [Actinomycetota bacterium]|nr:CoA transferase [Actinomycetota bacterium]